LNHDVIDAQRGTAANSCMRMGTRRLDEEFDLTDYLLDQWEADFAV